MQILVLGTLTHLARTRPRFILFTSSHDLLVSDPDVESGNETRVSGGRFMTKLSRAAAEKWQKEAHFATVPKCVSKL